MRDRFQGVPLAFLLAGESAARPIENIQKIVRLSPSRRSLSGGACPENHWLTRSHGSEILFDPCFVMPR